jgi:solute:Na+ symporter, SSS family
VAGLTLAALDWAVIALFIAGILALGFSARLRSSSILQFLVAGRALTLPVFVATLVSTWYGGILGIGEAVSYFGIGTWILLGVPYYLFALIYAWRYATRVREAEQISIPDRLELRYGKPVALLGAGLLFLIAVPAAHVLMLGILVQLLTGWPAWLSVLVGAGVGLSFMVRGGLLADARVSLLAFLMMYIGFGVMVAWCLTHLPLPDMLDTLRVREEAGAWLRWDGGTGPLYVLSFMILGAWTLIDPAFHQRVASAESPHTGRNGVLASIGFWFLFDALTITTGLYALAVLPPDEARQPLMLFPALGEEILPAGLKAVFLCGMLGTITSAMVGYMLVSGSTIGRELVARWRGEKSESRQTAWTRVGLFAAAALAIGLALSIGSVVDLWYQWGGIVIGALLLPVSVAYGVIPRSRASAAWIFGAMAVSAIGSLGWMIYGRATGNLYLEASLAGHNVSIGTLLPGLAVSALVVAAGEAVARSGSRGG